MAGRRAIRGKTLYRILFFGIIFTVVAVGALALWGVREVRRDAAAVAVESSARGVAGAVTVLVNAVTASNEEIKSKGLASLNPEVLRTRLFTTLEAHPSLMAIMVADGEGMRYSLARRFDGVIECIPDRGAGTGVEFAMVRKDGSVTPTKSKYRFDRHAMDKGLAEEFAQLQPGEISWRSIYRFIQAGESMLSASTLVEEGGELYMMSFVFPVDAVARQLEGAEKGSAEKVFLYWDSGKVLPVTGLSQSPVTGDGATKALTADKVEDPIIAGAVRLMAGGKIKPSTPYSFRAEDATWWAYVMPLSVFGDTMSLGVAVPRKNIVSTLTSDTFLQVFGGILVLFAFAALFFVHRNKGRIEVMGQRAKAAKTAQDVLKLIADGESANLEFKQTLRFNLKAGKNGKEIEHASLKSVAGFMNSEGGTLLVGVADSGEVTGFAEDKFENEDKALLHFNNLVNQSIGTEFSRYLDTAIIEVQGKWVLRAYCMPAAVPAILTHNKSEEFYIRSGPASRSLTLSQFYEWLQNH